MPQAEIHFQMTGWGKDLIAPFGVGVAPEKKGKNLISRQKTLDVYKSEQVKYELKSKKRPARIQRS